MSYASKLLTDAVEGLSRLPGIGKKTALRLALYLIRNESDEVVDRIIDPLRDLVTGIRFCQTCNNLSDDVTCSICKDRTGSSELICVVESVRDVMAIEETGQYRGLYHVLGGVISPLDGISASDLNIDKLVERASDSGIKEIIMAISPTIEGETTIYYISRKLTGSDVTITQLARGIAFGGELEYADEMTLGRSIITRIPYRSTTL